MKKVVLFAALLFIQSCSTIHQLGMTDLPLSEVAILSGPTNIHVLSITGMEKDLNPKICSGPLCGAGFQLYIPEGQRKVKLYYSAAVYTPPVEIEVFFEAGVKYTLIINQDDSKIYYGIVKDSDLKPAS